MAISTLVRLMAQFQIIQCAWDRCWLRWDLGNIWKLIHDIKLIYADFPASTIQCCWGQVRKMWKFYQNFPAANPFLPLVYEPGLSLSDQIYAPPCLRSIASLFLSIYLSLSLFYFLSLSIKLSTEGMCNFTLVAFQGCVKSSTESGTRSGVRLLLCQLVRDDWS